MTPTGLTSGLAIELTGVADHVTPAGLMHALVEHRFAQPPWWKPLARMRWRREMHELFAAFDPAPPPAAQ